MIRAIVELGGTYPDVVQAMQEAKAAGCLEGRFEVDAVPEAGRSYEATLDDEPERRRKAAKHESTTTIMEADDGFQSTNQTKRTDGEQAC